MIQKACSCHQAHLSMKGLLLKIKALIKNVLVAPCFVLLDTVLEKWLLFDSFGTRKHFQELFL